MRNITISEFDQLARDICTLTASIDFLSENKPDSVWGYDTEVYTSFKEYKEDLLEILKKYLMIYHVVDDITLDDGED